MASEYCLKMGDEIVAEALTLAVVRRGRPVLFLTRVMPGRWAVQRPGTAAEDATPAWAGPEEGFVSGRVPTFPEGDELVEAVRGALERLESASPKA